MATDKRAFEFIEARPDRTPSPETLRKIRRHAMRAVGAARREYQREHDSHRSSSTGRYPLQQKLQLRLSPAPPLSDVEKVMGQHGLEPLDLSALTSVHLGSAASKVLQSSPESLRQLLSCHQQSYLAFVPQHFGTNPALDDAFRSLLAAARHQMNNPKALDKEAEVLACYDMALRSLQAAVNDDTERGSSEALCATGLLAMYEIVNPSSQRLWDNHIAGASLLVQLRGPHGFTSDFEKALLTGLVYPITAEALHNGKACFLATDTWHTALDNVIIPDETFTTRSALGIAMMQLMTRIPGLASRTDEAFALVAPEQNDEENEQDLQMIHSLAAEAHKLRQELIAWRRGFDAALIHNFNDGGNADASLPARDAASRRRPQSADAESRYELLGISLVARILTSRLLASLSTWGVGAALLLEDEVLSLATELKSLQTSLTSGCGGGSSSSSRHRAHFALQQKVRVADAAMATHADFRSAATRMTGRVVASTVLGGFWKALGRTSWC